MICYDQGLGCVYTGAWQWTMFGEYDMSMNIEYDIEAWDVFILGGNRRYVWRIRYHRYDINNYDINKYDIKAWDVFYQGRQWAMVGEWGKCGGNWPCLSLMAIWNEHLPDFGNQYKILMQILNIKINHGFRHYRPPW